MKRVAVLTGASRGIGSAIAEDLAPRYSTIVLGARDGTGLEETASKVRAANGRPVLAVMDVRTDEGRNALIAAAEAEGDIEVFVNNAGVEVPVPVVEQSLDEIEAQFDVNLRSPILLTRQVLPGMIRRGRGAIVMISSMSGKSPTPYNSIYSATKFGLNGFAGSLQFELEGTGVRVGVVCPGFVSGRGMWADTKVKAPLLMREVSIEKVVAAVQKVISGRPEVLVTPGPVRPLLALSQLRPTWIPPILHWMGITDVLEERAQVVRRKRSLST
jgi:short-subunit dehydrogenase